MWLANDTQTTLPPISAGFGIQSVQHFAGQARWYIGFI